jgi:excisionase family DNA binding protein
MDPLLTIREAAGALNVSSATIRRLIADGELSSVTVRGAVRITRDDLERYVEGLRAHRVESKAVP